MIHYHVYVTTEGDKDGYCLERWGDVVHGLTNLMLAPDMVEIQTVGRKGPLGVTHVCNRLDKEMP